MWIIVKRDEFGEPLLREWREVAPTYQTLMSKLGEALF